MYRTVPALLFILLNSTFCLPAPSRACPQISASDASQQMTTLSTEIRHHNRLYYEKAQPVISDAEYDRLFASLVEMERCFPAQSAADSPTRTVNSDTSDGTRMMVKHVRPMLSLSSTAGPEAVEALLKRAAAVGEGLFLVQPKVDGLPVELVYDAGRLISASTRGDGSSGVDVTERVRKIQGVPHLLPGTASARVVVRGEIYADLALLKNYRSGNSAEKYATPRHLAAGVLKAQDPDPGLVALLRLFPFELVTGSSVGGNLRSDHAALTLLSGWGFPVTLEQTHTVKTFAEVQAVYQSYLVSREQQPFAMDGIVVKVDDLVLRQQLGEGTRAPFWAAAWKFPPETARTRVLKIHWAVGRTGRRTPVAEVAPVRLGGVLVTRVSLQNDAGIARLNVASGDQVVIALAGDVIPQVLEVVGRAGRDSNPGAVLIQNPVAALDACLHNSTVCRNQFLARAVYFVSKKGITVSGLGRKRLQKLVEAGLVVDLPSLFVMKADEVAFVSGFSPETAQQMIKAIHAAGHTKSFRIVSALGIPDVGPKRVQSLSRQFSSLDMLLAAGQEQVAELSPANFRTAHTIRSFFNTPGGKELLLKFRELGLLQD